MSKGSGRIYPNNTQEGDPVVFDDAGNMIFIVSESSSRSYTNYKYNPASEVCNQLTAAKNNIIEKRTRVPITIR